MFEVNQNNLRSGRRFRTDKRKYYFKQPSYGKPDSRYKMSRMLRTKINAEDDQIRKKASPLGGHETK